VTLNYFSSFSLILYKLDITLLFLSAYNVDTCSCWPRVLCLVVQRLGNAIDWIYSLYSVSCKKNNNEKRSVIQFEGNMVHSYNCRQMFQYYD